jgi:hypothetical protein
MFDSGQHLRARPIAAMRDTTRKRDRGESFTDRKGRAMAKPEAKKSPRQELAISGALDHV